MRDRSMRSGTKLAREIQLTDWSTAGNLSNRSSGVQIPRDICTRFGRYLYSTKCSWIINPIIIWQDSLEVNPSVLIGSFLVGILPYGPFPRKQSYAVYFFGFRKPRRQIQTTKRKCSNTLIFAKKLPKRLIFYRAYNKNEEHKYSRSEFCYPEDLMQRLTQASANVKTIL